MRNAGKTQVEMCKAEGVALTTINRALAEAKAAGLCTRPPVLSPTHRALPVPVVGRLYDRKTGAEIARVSYSSMTEAARLGGFDKEQIRRCLIGRASQHAGYKWERDTPNSQTSAT